MQREAWPVPNSVVMLRTARRSIVWFGPLSGLAIGVGCWFALAYMRLLGLDADHIAAPLSVAVVLGVMAGSRAFSLLLDLDTLIRSPRVAVRRRGLAFQGGMVGAIIAVFVVAHCLAVPTLLVFDALSLALPVGHAIGRLACLSYGCCYGRPTRVPWAIVVRNPEAKVVREWGPRAIGIHPTQIYQALGCVAHALVLWSLASSGRMHAGQIMFTYLVLSAIGRLVLECLRGEREPRTLGLTPFQCFALAQLSVGITLLATVAGDPLPFSANASLPAALAIAMARSWPWIFGPALIVAMNFGLHGKQVGSL